MALKKNLFFVFSLLFFIIFFVALYKLYIPRVNAFGCFDDCFNFLGGYFLNSGKTIYTDFFYNHQPAMAYLSALTQGIFHPSSIPELILRHRQVIFFISFGATLCLFLRFRYPIIIASILYEPFKFYVFGDRFLAESIVGYLLIYMVGICLYSLSGKFNKYDSYLMPVVGFLIIFLREPFIPAAIFLFTTYIILLAKNDKKFPYKQLIVFLLPFTIFLSYNLSDYYLNVVMVNKLVIASSTSPFMGLLISFFYPIFLIATPGEYNLLRILFLLYSICFIFALLAYTRINKRISFSIFLLFTLFLINLRPTGASQSFYEAFHIAPWLAVFVFTVSFLLFEILKKQRKTGIVLLASLVFSYIFLLFNKTFFFYDKIDTSSEYFTNFSHVMDAGTTIRNLSEKGDTLFVDGYDDLIIWEAGLKSPYKYTWYTSYMPKVEKYVAARNQIMEAAIPDFYYGRCINVLEKENTVVSQSMIKNYIQLNPLKDKSCILVNKKKANSIPVEKRLKLVGTKYNFSTLDTRP